MKFCSFASGSAGNCYFIGSENRGILIDAGISERRLTGSLRQIGVAPESIEAVFVTHDHWDHVSGLERIAGRRNLPVYSSEKIRSRIISSHRISPNGILSCRAVKKEVPTVVGDINVTAFQVYHDTPDCVGYRIECGGSAITIATDLGYINPEAERYLLMSDNIVIEANYNLYMLEHGSYAAALKSRIVSSDGHLPNHETAAFLAKNAARRFQRVFFCHLSANNNDPDQVMADVSAAFDSAGIPAEMRPEMHALPRMAPTELYEL